MNQAKVRVLFGFLFVFLVIFGGKEMAAVYQGLW